MYCVCLSISYQDLFINCVSLYLMKMQRSTGAVCNADSLSWCGQEKWSTAGVKALDGEAIDVSAIDFFLLYVSYGGEAGLG